jgi:hypothetical protein
MGMKLIGFLRHRRFVEYCGERLGFAAEATSRPAKP